MTERPNFRQPLPRTSINGFPIRFREDKLSDSMTLWVPQRITRNMRGRFWRIKINHADGSLILYEFDGDGSPLESLERAWDQLVVQLNKLTTPVTRSRRRTLPGPKRNPALDTGVDGVIIGRQKARNNRSKAVSVRMIQRLACTKATSRPHTLHTFSVSETRYLQSPAEAQKQFEHALCLSAAIRAKYLETYARHGPVPRPITADDIDEKDVPATPVTRLDLAAIFDTFD